MNELADNLSFFDYFIFILILVVTFAFVLYGNLKGQELNQSESDKVLDMLLMGRKLTLPMFTATLVATWYGGIYGVAELAFKNGIYNFITQGFFWYLTYLIFAFFLVDKIAPYKAITLPDLVGKIFGVKSEKLAALFNILNLVPVAYCISLGLFIKMLFNLPLELSIISGVLIVLSYSLIGGFRSVVFSDIFQFFIMTSSVLLVFILSFISFGISPLENLPGSYFHPLGEHGLLETLAWGLIALGTLVDPNFYQRCFAVDKNKTAKRGIILSTFVWIIFDLSLTFGAMYAKATMPEAEASTGYFVYALSILPDGLRGFFLAGICATILSTLDSYLFLAGTTLSYDLLPARFQKSNISQRISIVLIGLIATLLSFSFDGNIKAVWKALGSISTSALLVPLMWTHMSSSKKEDITFLLSASFGAFASIWWRLSGSKETYSLDEIYVGVIASIIGLISSVLITRFQAQVR